MNRIVLDAGAFISLEGRTPKVMDFFNHAGPQGLSLVTSAGVVGQVWRGDRRQAPIAMVLKWSNMSVVGLDFESGRTIGKMLAATGASDVIDAHIVLLARTYRCPVITFDPDDLRRLDPTIELWKV